MLGKHHIPIAIVGAGPGGLALAVELIEMGMSRDQFMVFEKGEVPIEAIRRFYPDKKMTLANYKGLPTETLGHLSVFPDLTKAQTLEYFDQLIAKYQIPIQYKSEVTKIIYNGHHFELQLGHHLMKADYVAVGIGILGRPNKPEYKLPNSLKQQILFDITSQRVADMNVLVVGGGDTSCEYSQVLLQEGNRVTLAYRKDKFTRMMEANCRAMDKMIASGSLRVWLSCNIKEIQDEAGRPKVIFDDEARFPSETFDRIVYAIGGTTPLNFLRTAGVECPNEWPKYGEHGETNIPRLYLIGDLVAGKLGGSIITAYNSAFRTAKHICSQLKAV